jgi:soluble lytic murein transglycosylase-like protein
MIAANAFWSSRDNTERYEASLFESSPVLTGHIDQQLLAPAALPGVGQMLSTARNTDATAGYGLGFDAGLLPASSNGWRAPRIEATAPAHEQKWVTAWLARKYRVAGDAANMLVSATYSTAKDLKFDPLLILAVMAIESGLNPIAESPVGAQGLMQVMSKVHHEKFRPLGGVEAALNPVANIRVGSMILKDYVKRGGSVEAGLKMYVGAAAFESDAGYGSKVMDEYRRLQEVARGKSVAMNAVVRRPVPTAAPAPAIADSGTVPAATAPAQNATAKPKLVDGSTDTPKSTEPDQRKVEVLASA